MKSAYELAMERLQKDQPAVTLTEEQKTALAEIDNRFRAQIAERKVFLGGKIEAARREGDHGALLELEDQLRREVKRLELECEEEKEKVRQSR